jgi:shikimate 5-dehydrogenase
LTISPVVVVGSGSLARALVHSLAVLGPAQYPVVLVARDAAKAEAICRVAELRSGLAGATGTRFRPAPLPDLFDRSTDVLATSPS